MGEITSLYFFDVVRVYVQNVASEEHIDAKFPIHFTLGSIVFNARNTKENRYAYHAAAMLTAYFNIAFCISVTVRIAQ